MSDTVEPALTPEEWAKVPRGRPLMSSWWVQCDFDSDAHRAAALALHGQPFGFTPADSYSVRDAAKKMRREYGIPDGEPHGHLIILQLDDLADRLDALMPPETSG